MRRTQWRSFCFKKNSASHMSFAALAALNISEKRQNLFQVPYWQGRRKLMKYLCPGACLWPYFIKPSRHKLYTNSPLWPILTSTMCRRTASTQGWTMAQGPVLLPPCPVASTVYPDPLLEEQNCPAGALGTKLSEEHSWAQTPNSALQLKHFHRTIKVQKDQ